MDREDVKSLLKDGLVEVKFIKANGEERRMNASLNDVYLPEQTDLEEKVQEKVEDPNNITVWDTQFDPDETDHGWRKIPWARLFEVNGQKFEDTKDDDDS